MYLILQNGILTSIQWWFQGLNFLEFKAEFGVQDILIVITLILTIILAIWPMHRQKAERKRYLLLVFGRFIGNAKKINTDKISDLCSKLLDDLSQGVPEIERTYLRTAYEEIKSLDRNDIYELLKSYKAFQGEIGFEKIHDRISTILELCDEWIFELEQYHLLRNGIYNRLVGIVGQSHDLMDKVDSVVHHNNFQGSLNIWPKGNDLLTVIINFYQANAGVITTVDTIMRDLVVPSLKLIRQYPIHYPQTPECNEFADLIRDIERLNAQQNVFLNKIRNEINNLTTVAIEREKTFAKMISQFKKINFELLN